MKKNIIVGQSGGPTAVINASLYTRSRVDTEMRSAVYTEC